MKKQKLISLFLLIIIMLVSACSFTACSTPQIDLEKTREFADMMSMTIDKIEEVNNMFLSSDEEEIETPSPMLATNSIKATSFSTTNIPNDIGFRKMHPFETISRQVQVKYPYLIVDYLLQTSAKGNLHSKKFDVDRAIYGSARKTISPELNQLFEDSSLPDPILAVSVDKTEDGFRFSADWDWRNDYLAQNNPLYNAFIMCDGQVEYFSNGKTIKRILMNWSWEYAGGDIMSCIMDFEKNEFYYLEAYKCSTFPQKASSLCFNDGEFTFDKILEYKYGGSTVIKSTISENPKDIDFQAYCFYDNDPKNVSSGTYPADENYYNYLELYNDVYAKLIQSGLNFRGKNNTINKVGGTKIDYMDSATSYGLNRSSVVSTPNAVDFIYLNEKDLKNILKDLLHDKTVKNNPTLLSLVDGAEKSLDYLNGPYVGELGSYNGKKYSLGINFSGGYSYAPFNHVCDSFSYEISDGTTTLTFALKKKKPEIISFYDCSALKIEYDPTHGYVLSCKDKSLEEIVIPSSLNNSPVQSISGFDNCPNLKKVTVMNGPYNILTDAFSNCPNLKEIILPDSIRSIGQNSFTNCTSLEKFRIPSSVYSVENNSFSGCSALKEVVVPPNFSTYELRFLSSITNLEKVVFEEGFTTIAGLSNLSNLKEVVIPNTVTTIERSAFQNCTSLTQINIPSSVTQIAESAFSNTGIKEITIPNSVTVLGYSLFKNCTSLTKVNLPDGIQKLDSSLFLGCTSLTQINIPSSVTQIAASAFSNTGIKEITIPNSVTALGYSLFENCTSLTKVNLPDGIQRLDGRLFSGCTSLTQINIPNSVTILGNSLFENCTSLTKVNLPDGIQKLDGYLFSGCTGLTELTIPDGVTNIGSSAFKNCEQLKEITIPNLVTRINDYTFEGCESLTSVIIPDNVVTIYSNAFKDCSSLSSITLGVALKQIESFAFSGCVNLKEIVNYSSLVLEKGSTNYGEIAKYAEKITSVGDEEIPLVETKENGFTIHTFSDYIFLKNYDGNQSILTLPDGITHIDRDVFKYNNTIYSITIPSSVKFIAQDAFNNCRALVEVVNKSPFITITSSSNIFYGAPLAIYNHEDTFTSTKVKTTKDFISYDDKCLLYCFPAERIVVPSTITSALDSAFSACKNIVTYLECNAELCKFSSSQSLQKVVITGGKAIPTNAFSSCTNLNEVIIADGVTSIGESAFYLCDNITKITLPSSITTINNSAFNSCHNLTEINLDNVRSVHSNAFHDCYNLEKVHLFNISYLGDNAFCCCDGLKEVVVKGYIDMWRNVPAFSACDNIETLVLGTQWASITFDGGLHNLKKLIFLKEFYLERWLQDMIFNYDLRAFDYLIWSTELILPNNIFNLLETNNKSIVISENALNFKDVDLENSEKGIIYFDGTEDEWNTYLNSLTTANKNALQETHPTVFFYSQNQPTQTKGNYWHIENGKLVIW